MRIIPLNHLPLPRSFYAINICGIIFCREELSAIERRHEYIHTMQQKELLFIFFYLLYVIEWFFRIIQTRNLKKAYFRISFEREAYTYQMKRGYRHIRKHFAWRKFL